MTGITQKQLSSMKDGFSKDNRYQLASLSLSKSNMQDVAFVSSSSNKLRQKFSVNIKTMEVTDQKSSGRCWLFAATNVLRERIACEIHCGASRMRQMK